MKSRRLFMAALSALALIASAASAQIPGKPTEIRQAIPLAAHPNGQNIIEDAMQMLDGLELSYTFLDKSYSNHVYATEPVTGKKVKVSCLSVEGKSGFKIAIDPPKFQLTTAGLTIQQRFPHISAQGVKVSFQAGPCVEHTVGAGVSMRDVAFTFRAKPMITFRDGGCKVTLNEDREDLRVSIGSMNVTGLQNDLDPLFKDALREGLNATLNGAWDVLVGNTLEKASVKWCK